MLCMRCDLTKDVHFQKLWCVRAPGTLVGTFWNIFYVSNYDIA